MHLNSIATNEKNKTRMTPKEIRQYWEKIVLDKDEADILEHQICALLNVSARNWAKMREDACRVREKVAINFMLEIYCDVEVTEQLQNQVYEDFKKRYVR